MQSITNTPAIAIDLDKVDQNIERMVSALSAHGVGHRPHTKTHKSVFFARRQIDLGAKGITCASLGEAEVMIDGGIKDVFIAYPLIGDEKLRKLGELMPHAELSTIINSRRGAEGLSALGERMGRRVPVLIDIDGGMGRGGLKPFEATLRFAESVRELPGIELIGLMYYNGQLSSCKGRADMEREAARERDELLGTAAMLRNAGFDIRRLSGGSSYSSALPHCIEGLSEARAGTYIFGDASLMLSGIMTEAQCALRVHTTVLSVVDEHRAILDAGSKTLSSDLCGRKKGYGYVCELPDAELSQLNEEHAFLDAPRPHRLSVGDILSIIPNHCCTVMNLADQVIGMRGGQAERMIRVDGRGKNR